jgi:hypothetical protein
MLALDKERIAVSGLIFPSGAFGAKVGRAEPTEHPAAVKIRLYHAHRALLVYAYNLHQREEYAAAVVFGQIASESCVGEAVVAMLDVNGTKSDEDCFKEIKTFNLAPTNGRLSELFRSVAKAVDLVDQQFWGELPMHLDRRNRIVHTGHIDVTLDEATESIWTVLRLIEYVEARTRAIL